MMWAVVWCKLGESGSHLQIFIMPTSPNPFPDIIHRSWIIPAPKNKVKKKNMRQMPKRHEILKLYRFYANHRKEEIEFFCKWEVASHIHVLVQNIINTWISNNYHLFETRQLGERGKERRNNELMIIKKTWTRKPKTKEKGRNKRLTSFQELHTPRTKRGSGGDITKKNNHGNTCRTRREWKERREEGRE